MAIYSGDIFAENYSVSSSVTKPDIFPVVWLIRRESEKISARYLVI